MKALLALAGALFLIPSLARANELTVDERRLPAHELLTITISLNDAFASLDEVHVPLRNLVLVGEPWTATEFAFINSRVIPRKVFRYRARAIEAGPAQVGPIELRAADGQRDTLPAIALEVLPDRAPSSNDAEAVLRELLAAGRAPVFLIAEIDRARVYAGEPVIVEWVLYNAVSVQQWQILSVPKLPDFWVEELSKNDRPERVYLGDVMLQRLPVRRIALFPLRGGRLRVGGMTMEVAVIHRAPGSPLFRYEGVLSETTFTSAPLEIDVRPIPPGTAVDAVGDFTLTCSPPSQRNGGPVVVTAKLAGTGNVRSVAPPRFEKAVRGVMQIEGGGVEVVRDPGTFAMSREWRYLVFPAKSGLLEIPPISMHSFAPAAGVRRELRCAASRIEATTVAASPPATQPAPPEKPLAPRWPWLVAALFLAAAWLAVPAARRALARRREVRTILRGASPAEIRARMESRVRIDLNEPTDRGDAWRALRSLLDAAERDRDIAEGAEKEIARRVADVLRT